MVEQSPSDIPQPEPPASQPEVMPKGEIPYQAAPVETPHHKHVSTGGWVMGLVLIALGALFMLQNMTNFRFENWWALFILIPAIGSFVNAWNAYQSEHRFSKQARSNVVGGFVLLLIMCAFLFALGWNLLWPLILVLVGLSILINGLLPD